METLMTVGLVLGLLLPPAFVVGGALVLAVARLSVYWQSHAGDGRIAAGRTRKLTHS